LGCKIDEWDEASGESKGHGGAASQVREVKNDEEYREVVYGRYVGTWQDRDR
jgi:hypothetical protein